MLDRLYKTKLKQLLVSGSESGMPIDSILIDLHTFQFLTPELIFFFFNLSAPHITLKS